MISSNAFWVDDDDDDADGHYYFNSKAEITSRLLVVQVVILRNSNAHATMNTRSCTVTSG
jgi:hypothetical protein